MTSIADFLLERLVQLGVKSIFGVPGDFNLAFLDLVEDKQGLNWVGCCNELNAGYAADGYARVTQGLGVLITTFGVGELSAVNAIAGSMAERVPVLHIVGMPSTKLQGNKALLHHTLGDGSFNAFSRMAAHVTSQELVLDQLNAKEAAVHIDDLLRKALTSSQPVYLGLPTDLIDKMIDTSHVEKHLTQKQVITSQVERPLKQNMVDYVLKDILTMWTKAERPCVLVDACAVRFSMQPLIKQLVEATGMAFFTTPMGKTALPEDHPLFSGCYIGSISQPEVRDHIESSDLVFCVGSLKSDFNTGSFSYKIPEEKTVELHSYHTKVAFAIYPDLTFYTFFAKLTEALTASKPQGVLKPLPNAGFPKVEFDLKADHLVQDKFWPQVARCLKPGDISVAETGTSSFGTLDARLMSSHQSQVLYGSIGWAMGAALGCTVAGAQENRRCVLFTGEGSAQVTVQDVSQYIRLGLKPVLFVLNNSGYTIERAIHGPKRHYNDVPDWDWQNTFQYFGAKPGQTKSYRVSTPQELEDLIQSKDFQESDKAQLVEVMLGKDDVPRVLKLQADLSAKANAE